ncbi:MAG: hypothetical protein ACXWLH_02490 [Candidatus Saccharimonadales bacterium]
MNGNAQNYQPSPDLPPPHQEILNAKSGERRVLPPLNAEIASKQAELPAGSKPVSNIPSMPFGPAPLAPPPIPSNPGPVTPTQIVVNDAPAAADDTDLIEKEWVNRAKYIVESTRQDPGLQNKELSKFKADYIHKRYNKRLKVSDD